MALDCDRSTASHEEARQALESARSDEAFVALILGIELLGPSMVIYAPLDLTELAAYADFASSAAGGRWRMALEDALRDTFAWRRIALRSP